MKYLGIVQARCGSSRLPGKILMDLAGKPVLQRVLERAARSRHLSEVMAVTSVERADIETVRLVSSLGYRVIAGSEEDVLDRYYQCAKHFKPEYVVRITGDCPLYDAALLDMAIDGMDADADYMAAITETLADGLDIEIFRYAALEEAWHEAKLKSEREHVTLYIRNHPERFKLQDFICPLGDLNAERWSLDEEADYALIKDIYEHLPEDFNTAEVLAYLDENPQVRALNAGIGRNEGLKKSLAEDGEYTQ